jgi:hypothetical protein
LLQVKILQSRTNISSNNLSKHLVRGFSTTLSTRSSSSHRMRERAGLGSKSSVVDRQTRTVYISYKVQFRNIHGMPPCARQPEIGKASGGSATTNIIIYRWLSAFFCIDMFPDAVIPRRASRARAVSFTPACWKGIVEGGVANSYHRDHAQPVHNGHFHSTRPAKQESRG